MLVGVISDTHDNVSAVDRAVSVFEERGVETVIHCGDVIAPPVVRYFDGLEVHGVLGNNDGELDGLESAFRQLGNGSKLHGRFTKLEFDGTTFAVLHGERLDDVEAHAASGEYEYVCYGHHHVAEEREVDGTTVLNPGAHFPTVPEEHHSIAIVDTESDDVEFVAVAE
ncbi:metallophosphoesterase [Natranaeroarchaeum aerophilus]|uniref:Phosphoesterase n=1 Tax=Natranaeroarchaeum aerophilus TaxID=2917711 RepID=A0AAE3FS84_9EURY|nr:metallophosphoesterase [Natranaeroarchaeum aerophilus]MCL9814246.1 metallophosphoesterase [Natranaeroarchaeum aerophilus]